MRRLGLITLVVCLVPAALWADESAILLKPERVFDGVSPTPHAGWAVLVRGNKIAAAGPAAEIKPPPGTRASSCLARRSCRA